MASTKPSSPSERTWRLDGRDATVLAETWSVFALVLGLSIAAAGTPRSAAIAAGAMTGNEAVWTFFAAFASATLLILILLRTVKGSRLFEVLFALAVFAGIGTLSAALAGPAWAVVITAASVLLYYGERSIAVFDLLLVAGSAGIAVQLSAGLRPAAVAGILALLAVYDILAVYVTKHMVAMAESLLRRKVFFAMILPERASDLLLPTSAVSPGAGFVFLGTGDVILPALLAASAARDGLAQGLLVAVGAFVGVTALHLIFRSQTVKKPMPALPPIAAGAVLGYLASYLV